MADFAILEKMGGELKCPICLSLLNSAVSLTCNHVFCNLCLTKSMKSSSHCPVCKVPYRRREIRPASRMDNIVSLYRTMEVASGVSIHVTQNAPTKSPDGKKELQVSGSDTGDSSHGNSKKQRILKKKGSKKLVKTLEETSDPQLSMKPSFPAKKRVHVPQCLQSETPTRIEKHEERLGDKEEKGRRDGSNVLKEKPSFTEGGQPVFSPFFWLREIDDNDEVERLSSQSMEIDHASDTSPQKFPSFSDIKESDNESPVKMTENEKGDTQSKLAAVFDSEMFEWTQRPGSPELCSTPVKNKVVYQNEMDRVQENNEGGSDYLTAPSREELVSENTEQGNGSTEMESLSSHKAKNKRAPNGRTRSNKSGKSKRKQDDLSVDEAHEDVETLWQENNHFTEDIIPYRRNKVCKNKKAMFGTQDLNEATEEALRFEAEVQNQIEEDMGKSTYLSRETTGSNENLKNGSCKTMEKNRNSHKNLHNSEKENIDIDTSLSKGIKEVSTNQDQRKNIAIDESLMIFCQNDDTRTYLGDKTHQNSMKADSYDQRKGDGNSRKRKILRLSNDDSAHSLFAGKVVKRCSKAAAKKTQTITVCQRASENMAMDNVQPTNKVLTVAKDWSLRKCESVRGQFCCAFCQSCKDSEVSGEMMHYSNGKPVAPDYTGGTGIIHAHKNCTEWAPNVYFEKEIAINLEPELARSRRIKCSCCGIKGAALGCYEKSCRKSFHVPCAKLVPQCRWDTDNFVMLCPLHPLSKLPKELSSPQGKRQKRYALKRESQPGKAEVMAHHGVSTNPLWKVPSHKWVLCCSGLTDAEKEVVSEFTKMTGVSLSKSYGPNVTHIIASTDENGACRRTLKFLMAILEGRWILKIDWIKACMKAMEPVAEEGYEISVDAHGIRDGPHLGRLRVKNKQPKLFKGCNFYFMGEFQPSYKGYLQDMVVAAGGNVLQRKPISGDTCGLSSESTSYIIYNADESEESGSAKKLLCSHRLDEAEALASSNGAKVAAHSWVLDSIAACNLQTL